MSNLESRSVEIDSISYKCRSKTTVRFHLTLVRMATIRKKKPQIYRQQMLQRVRRKRNPLALLVGMQIDTATMENSKEGEGGMN